MLKHRTPRIQWIKPSYGWLGKAQPCTLSPKKNNKAVLRRLINVEDCCGNRGKHLKQLDLLFTVWMDDFAFPLRVGGHEMAIVLDRTVVTVRHKPRLLAVLMMMCVLDLDEFALVSDTTWKIGVVLVC